MKTIEQQRYYYLYEQHLINLRLQGKRPSTIETEKQSRTSNKTEQDIQ